MRGQFQAYASGFPIVPPYLRHLLRQVVDVGAGQAETVPVERRAGDLIRLKLSLPRQTAPFQRCHQHVVGLNYLPSLVRTAHCCLDLLSGSAAQRHVFQKLFSKNLCKGHAESPTHASFTALRVPKRARQRPALRVHSETVRLYMCSCCIN